jgi:hypothetical protein
MLSGNRLILRENIEVPVENEGDSRKMGWLIESSRRMLG